MSVRLAEVKANATSPVSYTHLDVYKRQVIAVASGVVFWMWDWVCMAPLTLFENITPGFEGLLNGFWLFAGPLAAVIVRKPGAALYAETVAAFLELTLGNQWGVGGSLIVGLMQGLGAELAFALFAYKVWTNLVVLLSLSLIHISPLICRYRAWTYALPSLSRSSASATTSFLNPDTLTDSLGLCAFEIGSLSLIHIFSTPPHMLPMSASSTPATISA